jgi:hypothetical protein
MEDLMRSPSEFGRFFIFSLVTSIVDTKAITTEALGNLIKWKSSYTRHRDSHNRKWKLPVKRDEKGKELPMIGFRNVTSHPSEAMHI